MPSFSKTKANYIFFCQTFARALEGERERGGDTRVSCVKLVSSFYGNGSFFIVLLPAHEALSSLCQLLCCPTVCLRHVYMGHLALWETVIQFATSCCYHFVIKVHNYCDLITWHTHTHPLASFTPSSRSIYWHLTFNWTLFSSTQHDLNLGRHSSYIVSPYMLHTCICLCGRYVRRMSVMCLPSCASLCALFGSTLLLATLPNLLCAPHFYHIVKCTWLPKKKKTIPEIHVHHGVPPINILVLIALLSLLVTCTYSVREEEREWECSPFCRKSIFVSQIVLIKHANCRAKPKSRNSLSRLYRYEFSWVSHRGRRANTWAIRLCPQTFCSLPIAMAQPHNPM